MSNETVYKRSTQVTVIAGTATLASNAFTAAGEVTSLSSTQTNNYPLADAVLFASFSTSVSSNSNLVVLYRRELNIDGSNDAPQPNSVSSTAYSNIPVGAFQIPAWTATSSGYFPLPDVALNNECEFYVENRTNSAIASTYTVKLTPKTFAPAP